jgi:hypothetical protein
MSRRVWESLSLSEKNRIRRAARRMQWETMEHIGRELESALAPFPQEGPITLDAAWLWGFAQRWKSSGSYEAQVNTDYLFERTIAELDR